MMQNLEILKGTDVNHTLGYLEKKNICTYLYSYLRLPIKLPKGQKGVESKLQTSSVI